MNTENQNIEFKESWGRGIEKICTLSKNYGIPEPEYTAHLGICFHRLLMSREGLMGRFFSFTPNQLLAKC